ncbi:MAG: carboxylesterase [Hyphomicrobiales bacterium]|nr:MAG: carboxylesterase [Hyphomicrobiales bacterium]
MPTRRHFIQSSALFAGSTLLPFSTADDAFAAKHSASYGANKLDIFPTNRASAPILVYVHGGAWLAGSKGSVGAKAAYFTRLGYVFISVGYTLYPRANAQTQSLQIGQAVNWVRKNASRLGGDPDKIALMGHSAGCHLAALAALTGSTGPINALICNDTRAYDLSYLARLNKGHLPLLYAKPFSKRKFWSSWSPISYAGLKEHPPILVAWSGGKNRDKISINFANALRREGSNVTHFDGSGRYSHISINSKMGKEKNRDSVTAAVSGFLKSHIG